MWRVFGIVKWACRRGPGVEVMIEVVIIHAELLKLTLSYIDVHSNFRQTAA